MQIIACISLTISDVFHLFVYLLVICLSRAPPVSHVCFLSAVLNCCAHDGEKFVSSNTWCWWNEGVSGGTHIHSWCQMGISIF